MRAFFMLKQNRNNSVTEIRNLFRSQQRPMTLRDIRDELPHIPSSAVSMTLCYFLKQRYVVRELIENTTPKERKKVFIYTYSEQRFPKEEA